MTRRSRAYFEQRPNGYARRMRGLIGLALLLALAYAVSSNRSKGSRGGR